MLKGLKEVLGRGDLDAMAYRQGARALDEVYEKPQRWKVVLGLFKDLEDLIFL